MPPPVNIVCVIRCICTGFPDRFVRRVRLKEKKNKKIYRREKRQSTRTPRRAHLLTHCKVVLPEHTVKHRVAVQQVRPMRLFRWRFGVKNDNCAVRSLIVAVTPECRN